MRKKDKKFILIHCNFRVIFFSLVAPVQHTCTYLKYREQTDGETSTKQAIETTSEPPQVNSQ